MTKLTQYLPYFGAIPFIAGAIAILFNFASVPILGDVKNALNVYGLIIAIFMAGAHWGLHLNLNEKDNTAWDHKLPICSNLISVFLWFAFIVITPKSLLITFILSFLLLLLIDWRLMKTNLISKQYFKTRLIVTSTVICSLFVSYLFY